MGVFQDFFLLQEPLDESFELNCALPIFVHGNEHGEWFFSYLYICVVILRIITDEHFYSSNTF